MLDGENSRQLNQEFTTGLPDGENNRLLNQEFTTGLPDGENSTIIEEGFIQKARQAVVISVWGQDRMPH